jgi:hypothetical protein
MNLNKLLDGENNSIKYFKRMFLMNVVNIWLSLGESQNVN